MPYIDGFVIAVPSANREKFIAHALLFDRMLMAEGALRVVETWGDDVPHGKLTDFHGAVQARDGETVCFSWVEWPDKATRDACHARMQERMASGELAQTLGEAGEMPFDGARMIFGGFEAVVNLGGQA
ncbi:DUF1428 domain-containing protein [Novosphingobium bradum]|uniref:DUF1428 domain-containing protein n=1 Tax=Novosphingobium bradum TaxID=1737444 RepID=A0ABV7IQ11_9SPHN